MSEAEVMTATITAMLYFRSNYKIARRFFYGLKLNLVVTEQGQPMEFFLTPGSYNDASAMKWYYFDVSEAAWITGDRAYTDYTLEGTFQEAWHCLVPLRKENSKHPVKPWIHYLQALYRKEIETTGSMIEKLLPKSIHAVTLEGLN